MYFKSNIEMFIDDTLIDTKKNVSLKLHTPIKKEKVITFSEAYEGTISCYITVLKFNEKYFMYYRGYTQYTKEKKVDYAYTCIALSEDGINFYKPNLNIIESNGSTNNNIILKDEEICHNFTPFVDSNPNCSKDSPIKAVGGHKKIGVNKALLYGLYSNDGIHFTKIQEQPVLTDGMFDSQNVVFFDNIINKYRCYSRYFENSHLENPEPYRGIRAIQSCTSDNFLNWDNNVKNKYNITINDEFYTNATVLLPHTNTYLSFPKRYISDRNRDFYNSADHGVSDCMFISSRDGINWNRAFLQAYVRPGLDRRNWINRNNMMGLGIVETSKYEFSMYISENYRMDTAGVRRLSIRKYGFASLNAGFTKGSVLTKPFKYEEGDLYINYSTSAVGYVIIHVLDTNKNILASSKEIYGDEIFEKVVFNNDITKYKDSSIRLLIELKDSDLYAFVFGKDE